MDFLQVLHKYNPHNQFVVIQYKWGESDLLYG